MFKRYTAHARRAVFFARWWALQAKSKYIRPEHLLLGLTHDRDSKAEELFHLCDRRDHFRKNIPGTLDLPSPAIMEGDIPLDNKCKRVLAYTAEEADRLNSGPIDTQHLVLGILCVRRSLGVKLLAQADIKLASARRLAAGSDPAGSSKPGALSWLLYFFVLASVIVAVYFVVR